MEKTAWDMQSETSWSGKVLVKEGFAKAKSPSGSEQDWIPAFWNRGS